jgi:N-acetylgalactosamine kinase
LQRQPGSYLCSLPEIDRMVHISRQTEGVVGAQLAGAGLGGCMMVLAHRDAVSNLVTNLTQRYYQPQGKAPTILICRPVAGCDVLMRDARS